jgi:uncharacterized integral membrane protein (TIGR00697 family)
MSKSKLNYLALILVLSITFLLISDATAAKIVLIFGIPVSISVLYFPVTYVLSDIITEVYGYDTARRILWMSVLCSILAGCVYQLAAYYPPAFPSPTGTDAYHQVFSVVPRIMFAGWIAVFWGDITNNYIIAKMKIWTKGQYFWMRAIASTAGGQLINTVLFVLLGLYGTVPNEAVFNMILFGWLFKVAVEAILLPFTTLVVDYLKKAEGQDIYDTETKFNPFLFK